MQFVVSRAALFPPVPDHPSPNSTARTAAPHPGPVRIFLAGPHAPSTAPLPSLSPSLTSLPHFYPTLTVPSPSRSHSSAPSLIPPLFTLIVLPLGSAPLTFPRFYLPPSSPTPSRSQPITPLIWYCAGPPRLFYSRGWKKKGRQSRSMVRRRRGGLLKRSETCATLCFGLSLWRVMARPYRINDELG